MVSPTTSLSSVGRAGLVTLKISFLAVAARARLEPQPDDAVPRFAYENHVRTLIEERSWPNSTVDISELRLVIDYQRQNGADRTLTIDIVDYPGEWLLDLPLLNKSFEQWSAESLALSREGPRAAVTIRLTRPEKRIAPRISGGRSEVVRRERSVLPSHRPYGPDGRMIRLLGS